MRVIDIRFICLCRLIINLFSWLCAQKRECKLQDEVYELVELLIICLNKKVLF